MPKFTDDEPVSNTCPDIDSILDTVKNHNSELCDQCEALNIRSDMETLRSSNSILRQWGLHWVDKYKELEKEKDEEISDLMKKVKELEYKVSDLESDLDKANKEVETLEEKLYQVESNV